MTKLKRKRIDISTEKRILTGLIVSTQFLRDVYPTIDLSYFQNSFARTIVGWCIDFYDAYKTAPFKHIQDIYKENKGSLKEEEAKLIATLLKDISERFEVESEINVDYYNKQADRYFLKRQLQITSDNLKVLLSEGKTEEAEAELAKFRKVQKETSQWINPLDNDEINKTFEDIDDDFFIFPGQLGEFLMPFEKGWLIGIAAPFKKGKSWIAQEVAIIGMLSGKRVVFFSLEMPVKKMKERIYKRLTGVAKGESEVAYPVFDCQLNQTGVCDKPERENEITLVDENENVPAWDPDIQYNICQYCRKNEPDNYVPATWYEMLHRDKYNIVNVGKKLEPFQNMFMNKLRIKYHPRNTANISDMMHDLDVLEHTEDFIPDIIVIDYADILKPERDNLAGVEKEDESWMALAMLGGVRDALVVVPTQVTKEALEAEQTRQRHTARWVGKLGHVDGMMALSQTPEEKEMGVMRISWMLHRHEDFFEEASVVVLQKLDAGQPHLDSEKQRRIG